MNEAQTRRTSTTATSGFVNATRKECGNCSVRSSRWRRRVVLATSQKPFCFVRHGMEHPLEPDVGKAASDASDCGCLP